tara:strand:- start:605 stop:877 length:273 start_codon:yes stop_codon:yes gene_type:complete
MYNPENEINSTRKVLDDSLVHDLKNSLKEVVDETSKIFDNFYDYVSNNINDDNMRNDSREKIQSLLNEFIRSLDTIQTKKDKLSLIQEEE